MFIYRGPPTLLPKILFRKVSFHTRYTSAMPKPKSPLPTLREKLASFDGAIGADDIARLLQTSRHTIYLWVRDNKIPYFRLNGCLKFDPALVADWIDSTSSTPKDPAPARKSEPASGSPTSKPAARRSAKPGRCWSAKDRRNAEPTPAKVKAGR